MLENKAILTVKTIEEFVLSLKQYQNESKTLYDNLDTSYNALKENWNDGVKDEFDINMSNDLNSIFSSISEIGSCIDSLNELLKIIKSY